MAPVLETRSLDKRFGGIIAANDDLARDRARRPSRADRAERRRQDHLRQSAHRRAATLRRRRSCSMARHHLSRALQAGEARHRAHLPDQPAVRRPHADRDAGARHLRAPRLGPRLVADRRHPPRRYRRDRRPPRALPPRRRDDRAHGSRCPTASSACSRSRSPSPAGRACSCSTSRRPACPRPSATTSSRPSPRCRRTSPCS